MTRYRDNRYDDRRDDRSGREDRQSMGGQQFRQDRFRDDGYGQGPGRGRQEDRFMSGDETMEGFHGFRQEEQGYGPRGAGAQGQGQFAGQQDYREQRPGQQGYGQQGSRGRAGTDHLMFGGYGGDHSGYDRGDGQLHSIQTRREFVSPSGGQQAMIGGWDNDRGAMSSDRSSGQLWGQGAGYSGMGSLGMGGEQGSMSMSGGQTSFRGRGPKGYQRSDERIKEMVSDLLEDHHHLDASEIGVQVLNGEVTLTGTVTDRRQKRLAEDCIEGLRGVRDVHNQLRVQSPGVTGTQGSQSQMQSGLTHDAGSTTSGLSASGNGLSTQSTGQGRTGEGGTHRS